MEEVQLGIDNIMSTEDVEALFDNGEETKIPPKEGDETEKKETIEVNPDTLFGTPESVDSGKEDNQEQGDIKSDELVDSPKTNVIYSSIAATLKEEGILSELDDEELESITNVEDLIQVFDKQIKAQLDDRYKRIDEALNYGVESSEIKRYESTIQYLDSLTEENLKDESEKGNTLRRQLIYQSFVNEGIDKDKATKLTERSFTTGADVEDAIEALETNKTQFTKEYQSLIQEAKEEVEKEEAESIALSKKFKEEILGNKDIFEGVPLDKFTKQKVYDNLSTPIYKDKNGYSYTAIQKYELEHKEDFLKKLGVLFTLTDGFKNIDKLVQTKVKKETKKSLRELEHVINGTTRNSDGSLSLITGASGEDSIHSTLQLDF